VFNEWADDRENTRVLANKLAESVFDPMRTLDNVLTENPYIALFPDVPLIAAKMNALCKLLKLTDTNDTSVIPAQVIDENGKELREVLGVLSKLLMVRSYKKVAKTVTASKATPSPTATAIPPPAGAATKVSAIPGAEASDPKAPEDKELRDKLSSVLRAFGRATLKKHEHRKRVNGTRIRTYDSSIQYTDAWIVNLIDLLKKTPVSSHGNKLSPVLAQCESAAGRGQGHAIIRDPLRDFFGKS
jgi:hypothetical protein